MRAEVRQIENNIAVIEDEDVDLEYICLPCVYSLLFSFLSIGIPIVSAIIVLGLAAAAPYIPPRANLTLASQLLAIDMRPSFLVTWRGIAVGAPITNFIAALGMALSERSSFRLLVGTVGYLSAPVMGGLIFQSGKSQERILAGMVLLAVLPLVLILLVGFMELARVARIGCNKVNVLLTNCCSGMFSQSQNQSDINEAEAFELAQAWDSNDDTVEPAESDDYLGLAGMGLV